jgi:hypothetical protein
VPRDLLTVPELLRLAAPTVRAPVGALHDLSLAKRTAWLRRLADEAGRSPVRDPAASDGLEPPNRADGAGQVVARAIEDDHARRLAAETAERAVQVAQARHAATVAEVRPLCCPHETELLGALRAPSFSAPMWLLWADWVGR